jgi:predicted enzyme related to lactoylglutathione lyase
VPDPLDALRTPIVPLAPDPVFAARLRRRLQEELSSTSPEHPEHPEQEEPMSEVLLRDRLSRNGTRHGDVSYLTLALPDAPAGRRFYGQVLGWTFGAGQVEPDANQVDRVIPQVGLWHGPWREGLPTGAILSWRVDDLAAAIEVLRAAGGTATDPIELPYGLQSEGTDGRGLRFWLHQLPPPGEPADPNGSREGDISYVVLRVADLGHSRQLLSRLLGWGFASGQAGFQVEGPVPMTGLSEGAPGAVLCYRVADVRAAAVRVAAAGGRAGEVESRPYGLESHCVDDQGVEFYLHQLG